MGNTSITFKFLNSLRLIHNEEKYGQISVIKFLVLVIKKIHIALCFRKSYRPAIFETRSFNNRRAKLWRRMGCKVGANVCIGHSVSLDIGNIELIQIEDNVIITNNCILLCHRRDVSSYSKYDDSSKLPYIYKPINLKKGCQIGMGSIIMPGVTIGEGAIIAARSVVTKDIPAWTIAAGSPCRVIRELNVRNSNEE